jgi:hypothetical protein
VELVFGVAELARGGEAVVYRAEHKEPIEIVIKCPLLTDPDKLAIVYDSIIYESQTLKLLNMKESIAQIKEEVILFNIET